MRRIVVDPQASPFDGPVDLLIAEFGGVEVLLDETLDIHVAENQRAEWDSRDQFLDLAQELYLLGMQLLEERRHPSFRRRRYWLCVCLGCGDPLLVSSGPKGWEGTSTLKGGCGNPSCAGRNKHGLSRPPTLEFARPLREITLPEKMEDQET